MVDQPRRAITQFQPDAAGRRRGGVHESIAGDPHAPPHPIDQPARAGRTHGASGDRLLDARRQQAKGEREMEHPVQAWRPDVAGRIENAPARTSVVMQFEPANRSADDQLHMGARFVKQRRALDGALTAAYDGDPHPLEPAEVTVRPGVRCERLRKPAGEGGKIRESIDPHRDNHSRCAHGPPIIELDRKLGAIRRQRFDQRGIDVWNGMPLEPQTVVHEKAQRDRLLLPPAGGVKEAVKVARVTRCREAGGAPGRSQVHAGGHPLPEGHGLAECLRR